MNELAPYIKVINSIVYVNKMLPYNTTNCYNTNVIHYMCRE